MAETRYVTLAEAKELLAQGCEERDRLDLEREADFESIPQRVKDTRKAQKRALNHAMDYTLDENQENELIGKLMDLGFVPEIVAFKIADLLPLTSNEVRAIFAKERITLDKDMIESILDLVSQY